MKTRNIIITLVSIALLTGVVSCVKNLEDEGIYNTTEYIGSVVEKSTMQPIPNVIVQVTDGTHIHATGTTDNNGAFSIKNINFDEVNKNYYLWIDGSRLELPSKQEPLKGLGRKQYDYKALILYNKTDVSLLPRVTTGNVVANSGSTGTAEGTVTYNGGREIKERGVCYSTHQTPTVEDQRVTAGTGLGAFTCNLEGLNRNTTYYVRAYAKNAVGISYGQQKMLTTKDGAPSVTIYTPTSITISSAICGGEVSDDGGYPVTERGVLWSTNRAAIANVTANMNNINHLAMGSGTGRFSGMITGLEGNTKYYIRTYAKNSYMIAWSSQILEFTTLSGLPTVTTTTAVVDGTTVTSGGNITADGGYPITARGICYGRFPNPDLTGTYNHTNDGPGNGYYSSTFEIDDIHGIYYIRAYATNSNGTAYGEQVIAVANPYDTLPTFMFNGNTYKVAPDPATRGSEFITWPAANVYCNNLTAYGYSDWRLPTIDELSVMYQNRASIRGWYAPYISTGNVHIYPAYWSGSYCNGNNYGIFMYFDDGSYVCDSTVHYQGYRIVDTDNGQFGIVTHVRPIRVDQEQTKGNR